MCTGNVFLSCALTAIDCEECGMWMPRMTYPAHRKRHCAPRPLLEEVRAIAEGLAAFAPDMPTEADRDFLRSPGISRGVATAVRDMFRRNQALLDDIRDSVELATGFYIDEGLALLTARAGFPDRAVFADPMIRIADEMIQVPGRAAEGAQLARKACSVARGILGDRHPTTMRVRGHMCNTLVRAGEHAEAAAECRAAAEAALKVVPESHPHILSLRTVEFRAMFLTGAREEAIEHGHACVRAWEQNHGATRRTAIAMFELSRCMRESGNLLEEAELLEACMASVSADSEMDSFSAVVLSHMARAERDRFDGTRAREIIALHERSLRAQQQVFGTGGPRTLMALLDLCAFEATQAPRRWAECAGLIQRCDDCTTAHKLALGADHPRTTLSMWCAAMARLRSEKPGGEGAELFRACEERFRAQLGKHHPRTMAALLNAAVSVAGEEGLLLIGECANRGPEGEFAVQMHIERSQILRGLGRNLDSVQAARDALRASDPDTPFRYIASARLASALAHAGEFEEAARLAAAAAESMRYTSMTMPLLAAKIECATILGLAGHFNDAVVMHQECAIDGTVLCPDDMLMDTVNLIGLARSLARLPARAADAMVAAGACMEQASMPAGVVCESWTVFALALAATGEICDAASAARRAARESQRLPEGAQKMGIYPAAMCALCEILPRAGMPAAARAARETALSWIAEHQDASGWAARIREIQ